MSSTRIVSSTPDKKLAFTNEVYVNTNDKLLSEGKFILLKGVPFALRSHALVSLGEVALNSLQRQTVVCSTGDNIPVSTWAPTRSNEQLFGVHFELDIIGKSRKITLKEDVLVTHLKERFVTQPLSRGQVFATELLGVNLQFKVKSVSVVVDEKKASKQELTKYTDVGIFHESTDVIIEPIKGLDRYLNFEAVRSARRSPLLNPDWKFADMGIGGLDQEFAVIFRRAFASRLFPAAVINQLGIKHVKGMLLYGPPGTGKTLIARQIGKMLADTEPIVVNGPEILNKYVGASEENVRKLFEPAEQDYQARGDNADLHIIIFDEIDAICKKRGSVGGGTGVHDTVVNQLLSKIDGVKALNNILVIGMTNRKDMIDEALLRPGRLEVHVEIGLPDEEGRLQIFQIHTKKMKENARLSDDVDLKKLAALTKNFSGAEIEGLVKSASSYALYGSIDVTKEAVAPKQDIGSLQVTMDDFLRALEEAEPAFGVAEDDLKNLIRVQLIDYGEEFQRVLTTCRMAIQQVQHSERTPVMSLLLHGAPHSGKTAIGAQIALESKFPFVKLVSPETTLGMGELGRAAQIVRVFDDAYRSPLSFVFLDNLERLLDYVHLGGARFSNHVLQTLLVCCKRVPPVGRKLLVVATTSHVGIIREMGLLEAFNVVLPVPSITNPDQVKRIFSSLSLGLEEKELDSLANVCVFPIGIKQLLLVIEMARQAGPITTESFAHCLRNAGLSRRSAADPADVDE